MEASTKALSRRSVVLAVGLFVCVGMALRGYRLGSPSLWVDEAESALNALTIVADGVPGDHFLGQPLYENTLVRPWPESPEYQFRDISYSDRGLAVYHSWLPLYSIAAAFWLNGVTPEAARQGTPLRDASDAEIYLWTAVPRLPAVAFGALSIIAAWSLGRHVYGHPAAAALAFAVATSDLFVYAGRQARYYSALVAGGTICGLAIWIAWRRGRFSDHALAGLAVGVLFHIHSVSAVAMSVLYVASCPLGWHQPRLWLRWLTAGTVSAVVVLPWAAWSGLLSQTSWMPAARDYIDVGMVLSSLPRNPAFWATMGIGVARYAAASRPGSRLSDAWRQPILETGAGLYFALGWLAASYLCFFAIMPAASFFLERLNLMVAVPLMLATSLLAAALGRVFRPSSVFLAVAGVAMILALWNELPPRLPGPSGDETATFIQMVRGWKLPPGGRLFASPNEHLVYTYYSGRPVQSIAPVRREWLDHFGNDLIILEGNSYSTPSPVAVQESARRMDRSLTDAEARSRAREARMLAIRLDLLASGVSVAPPRRAPDALDHALVDLVRQSTRMALQASIEGLPLAKGASLSNWQDFRNAFFYWFSDPSRRTGAGLNYRACRAEAYATVLPNGVTVLDCRRIRQPPLVPAVAGPAER